MHEMFTNFAKSRDSRNFHAREYLLLVLSYQSVFENSRNFHARELPMAQIREMFMFYSTLLLKRVYASIPHLVEFVMASCMILSLQKLVPNSVKYSSMISYESMTGNHSVYR